MSAITTRDLVEIDERRLLRRLDDLAQRGALPQGGIYRPLYSPQWSSAMELVSGWMKDAGLLTRRDAVGNAWGRIEGSRGGRVIAIHSDNDKMVPKLAECAISIPQTNALLLPIISVIPTQLFSYHVADHRGTDVDQPRNLAKSVTVE